MRWHVALLQQHIGHLEPQQVHDQTLEGTPPLITMPSESPRLPNPITGTEQGARFRRLPAHLARMTRFRVNTGLRNGNVCGLEWQWEVRVPEVGRSVFVIPPEAFNTKRPHVVVLNDVAWSIIESQRWKHRVWVFPYRDRRIGAMNDTGWRQARRDAGLPSVRVHVTPSRAGCVPPVFRPKIVKFSSATQTIRWRGTTRVPMWAVQ